MLQDTSVNWDIKLGSSVYQDRDCDRPDLNFISMVSSQAMFNVPLVPNNFKCD